MYTKVITKQTLARRWFPLIFCWFFFIYFGSWDMHFHVLWKFDMLAWVRVEVLPVITSASQLQMAPAIWCWPRIAGHSMWVILSIWQIFLARGVPLTGWRNIYICIYFSSSYFFVKNRYYCYYDVIIENKTGFRTLILFFFQ